MTAAAAAAAVKAAFTRILNIDYKLEQDNGRPTSIGSRQYREPNIYQCRACGLELASYPSRVLSNLVHDAYVTSKGSRKGIQMNYPMPDVIKFWKVLGIDITRVPLEKHDLPQLQASLHTHQDALAKLELRRTVLGSKRPKRKRAEEDGQREDYDMRSEQADVKRQCAESEPEELWRSVVGDPSALRKILRWIATSQDRAVQDLAIECLWHIALIRFPQPVRPLTGSHPPPGQPRQEGQQDFNSGVFPQGSLQASLPGLVLDSRLRHQEQDVRHNSGIFPSRESSPMGVSKLLANPALIPGCMSLFGDSFILPGFDFENQPGSVLPSRGRPIVSHSAPDQPRQEQEQNLNSGVFPPRGNSEIWVSEAIPALIPGCLEFASDTLLLPDSGNGNQPGSVLPSGGLPTMEGHGLVEVDGGVTVLEEGQAGAIKAG